MVLVTTPLSKEIVTQRAVQHMSAKEYYLISKTETTLVFEDGKDIDNVLLFLGILFFLIGALLYYFLAKRHTITMTINETDSGTNVQCTTNTSKSMLESNTFLESLSET